MNDQDAHVLEWRISLWAPMPDFSDIVSDLRAVAERLGG